MPDTRSDGKDGSPVAATEPGPASLALAADVRVSLQVGDGRFTTMRDTLTSESTFFASLLSGRWDNRLADGSYFIDADPVVFGHVLDYLRRGVFPVFFDKERGHDHGKYHSLLAEARYFGIPALSQWIAEKRYLDAVRIVRDIHTFQNQREANAFCGGLANDTIVEKIEVQSGITKVYLCPAEKLHKGDPSKCDKWCAIVQGSETKPWRPGEMFVEEVYKQFMVTTVKTVFDHEVCMHA